MYWSCNISLVDDYRRPVQTVPPSSGRGLPNMSRRGGRRGLLNFYHLICYGFSLLFFYLKIYVFCLQEMIILELTWMGATVFKQSCFILPGILLQILLPVLHPTVCTCITPKLISFIKDGFLFYFFCPIFVGWLTCKKVTYKSLARFSKILA